MKKCPTCQKIYDDDSMSFCLDCGSVLTQFSPNEPPATVQVPFPRETNPPKSQASSPYSQPPANYGQPNYGTPNAVSNFGTVPPANAVPKRGGSGCIYWILGLVAGSVVLGIVGIIGLGIFISQLDDNNNNNNRNNNNTSVFNGGNSSPTPTKTTDNTNTSTKTGALRVKDDFSKWRTGTDAYATTTYTGGEYQVSSSRDKYYYVLLGAAKYEPRKGYSTSYATTRLTVRSVTGVTPTSGFGLVVHSDPKPLTRDYAFLIRVGNNPAFRVVQHSLGKDGTEEKTLVEWTKSTTIRTGTASNQLEVRADGTQLSFYINGQFATSINDEIRDGIAGIYTSDTTPVAFDDLQILENN